jgi:ABC-2 type transport system permease protein
MKMLTIIRWELWQRRWALVWWSIGAAVLIGLDMLLYLSVKDQSAELAQVYKNLSPTFRALFSDNADFLSAAGFLSARVYYLLLPLLLSVFTIGLGSSLIARDEQQGTLELLLARPVSRTKLLLSKISAGIACIAIVSGVALVVGLVCLRPAGFADISHRNILFVTLSSVLLCSLFGAIAFMCSALGRPARTFGVAVAALFGLGSYIISSLEGSVHWLAWPAKLLPYHYYRPSDILAGTTTGKFAMLGFSITIVVLLAISWIGFRRRDIR